MEGREVTAFSVNGPWVRILFKLIFPKSRLVLLDLSAAFDTVDHCILVERLRQWVRISGSALEWFSCYLSDRSFSVTVHTHASSAESLLCNVPQGSVLSLMLFALYMLSLG